MSEVQEVKHADLQKSVKDINTVLGTKQNPISGRQVLIDFIVGTIGGCIGPNPENPEEEIWVDERAGNLSPETLNTYEALSAPAAEAEASQAEATAVEQQSPEVAEAEATGQPDPNETVQEQPAPKECPEFGKGYDAADPACAKPCKRAEECQTVMAEAAAAAPTGRKPRKTAEEKEAEKQAKAAEREAKKQERAAAKAAGKTPGGPSNKQKVYASWKADQAKTTETLGAEVGQAIQQSTIKAWISQWKKGNNLPAGATA